MFYKKEDHFINENGYFSRLVELLPDNVSYIDRNAGTNGMIRSIVNSKKQPYFLAQIFLELEVYKLWKAEKILIPKDILDNLKKRFEN